MKSSRFGRRRATFALTAALALVVSACGSDNTNSKSARGDRNSSTSSLIKAYTYSSDAGQTSPVAIDYASDGSRYVFGNYQGTVDFDSSDAVNSLTSSDVMNSFLAKHDSNGALLWVKEWRATSGVTGYDMEVDSHGDVVIAGNFRGDGDLDPGTGVTAVTGTTSNIFYEKVDSNGDYKWSYLLTGPSIDSITLLSDGSVVATGVFGGTQDFDASSAVNSLTATPSGTRRSNLDIYVLKITSAGEYSASNRYGGAASEYVYDIASDGSNNVYLSGSFVGTTDFGSTGAPMAISAVGASTSRTGYVAKINSSGATQWIRGIAGSSYSSALSVDVGNDGIIRVGGGVSNSSEMTAANPMTIYPYASATETPTVSFTALNGSSAGYLLRLTSDGNPRDIHSFSSTSALEASGGGVTRVLADESGNTYVVAITYGAIGYSPVEGETPVVNYEISAPQLFKVSSSGNLDWVSPMKGLDSVRSGAQTESIALDPSGNVSMLTYISGPYDLNPLGTAIEVDPGVDSYTTYTIVVPAGGPVLTSTGSGTPDVTVPATSGSTTSDPIISIVTLPLQFRISNPLTASQVAGLIGLRYPASSKLALKVSSTSKTRCIVERKMLVALKTGNCKVTVTAKPKKGKTKSKTGTVIAYP